MVAKWRDSPLLAKLRPPSTYTLRQMLGLMILSSLSTLALMGVPQFVTDQQVLWTFSKRFYADPPEASRVGSYVRHNLARTVRNTHTAKVELTATLREAPPESE